MWDLIICCLKSPAVGVYFTYGAAAGDELKENCANEDIFSHSIYLKVEVIPTNDGPGNYEIP